MPYSNTQIWRLLSQVLSLNLFSEKFEYLSADKSYQKQKNFFSPLVEGCGGERRLFFIQWTVVSLLDLTRCQEPQFSSNFLETPGNYSTPRCMSFRLTILFFSSPMSYTFSICTRSSWIESPNLVKRKISLCQQIVICTYKRFPSHIAFQNVNLSVWKKFPIDFMQWMVLLENLNFLSKCEGNSSCQGNFILVSHLNTFLRRFDEILRLNYVGLSFSRTLC